MEKKIALSIKGLKVRYGAIEAVKGIDLEVAEGSVVALLGANGAGKTSTLQTISGLNHAAEGTITYYGKDITNMDAEKIAALGMAQSPEGRQIFGDLTVEENLWAGSFTLKDKKKIKECYERCYKYFPRLEERKKQMAGTLSGGELQRVLLALALEPLPNLLILDEPLSGVDVEGMELLMEMLDEIRQTYDLSILMITHDFSMLGRYADQVLLLDRRPECQGTPFEVLNSEAFRRVFHRKGGTL